MSSLLHALRTALPDRDSLNFPLIATTSLATLALLHLSRLALRSPSSSPAITRGPSSTLSLSPSPTSATADSPPPYPPDALPGGRDVDSPYGNIRVYEWGPEDGRKVLLVHGITTPCLALGAVAHGLVDKGCRVMLFDLFGRGYSDAPTSLPHDSRLYTTQILISLTSSPLPWTTTPGFDILGYSLGGGIATVFTSYFPGMVRSLLLLAPAGLIRSQHMGARNRVLYFTGLVPEGVLVWLSRRRLLAGPMYARENKADVDADADAAAILNSEVPGVPNSSTTPLSRTYPHLTLFQAVHWHLLYNPAFVPSFLSCIRHAPITEQHDAWRRIRDNRSDKVLLVVGSEDPIVIPREVREDAEAILGGERVEFVQIEGAHDFPVTDSGVVVDAVVAFWGNSA